MDDNEAIEILGSCVSQSDDPSGADEALDHIKDRLGPVGVTAYLGAPVYAEDGIKAFVALLKARRPHASVTEIGPEGIDILAKAALKGKTR